jgi:8-oxo-dGTP diphosphatase
MSKRLHIFRGTRRSVRKTLGQKIHAWCGVEIPDHHVMLTASEEMIDGNMWEYYLIEPSSTRRDVCEKCLLERSLSVQSIITSTGGQTDTLLAAFSTPPRVDYVCGFYFSRDLDQVLLIRKAKPDWMEGRYNGIGGKIEPGEFPKDAMAREFEEEADFKMPATEWREFVYLRGEPRHGSYGVHFFYSVGLVVSGLEFSALERKDSVEPTFAVSTRLIPELCLSNLRWLIPMAKELILQSDNCSLFEVRELTYRR